MLDPVIADRMERSRQRAIRILTIVLSLAGIFCLFLSYRIINPPARGIILGNVNDFPIGKTLQIAVERLNVSDVIPNRPNLSDDPLFITRNGDGTWRAILGWDSKSGCIVQWDDGVQTFTDTCSGNMYDAQGLIISEQSGLRLGSLPVEEVEGKVRLRDQFLPDPRR